eukprot:gene15040-biopygen9638
MRRPDNNAERLPIRHEDEKADEPAQPRAPPLRDVRLAAGEWSVDVRRGMPMHTGRGTRTRNKLGPGTVTVLNIYLAAVVRARRVREARDGQCSRVPEGERCVDVRSTVVPAESGSSHPRWEHREGKLNGLRDIEPLVELVHVLRLRRRQDRDDEGGGKAWWLCFKPAVEEYLG